jgi:DNA-binding transcriptional MocR family regulator
MSTTSAPISFLRAVPPPEALPGAELATCFAAALARDRDGLLQYGQAGGYLPLRQVLARRHGTTEQEVFAANGSLHLMDLLRALLARGGIPSWRG